MSDESDTIFEVGRAMRALSEYGERQAARDFALYMELVASKLPPPPPLSWLARLRNRIAEGLRLLADRLS